MNTDELLTVTRTISLDASADEVWRLLTDDAELSLWFSSAASHRRRCPEASAASSTATSVRRAVVHRVEPGRRLGFTWWDENDPGRGLHRRVRRRRHGHRRSGRAHRSPRPWCRAATAAVAASAPGPARGSTSPTRGTAGSERSADRLAAPLLAARSLTWAGPPARARPATSDPAPVFAALADPTRRAVLQAVAVAGNRVHHGHRTGEPTYRSAGKPW